MKSLIILCSMLFVANVFACDKEAMAFLKKRAPEGSKIDVTKVDSGFQYSVNFKSSYGSYQENGSLLVSEGCSFSVKTSQVQKTGKVDVPQEVVAALESDSQNFTGTWESQCIQMQNSSNQGYATERYSFTGIDQVSFTRNWFKNPGCKGKTFQTEKENGKFIIGNSQTNNGFNPVGTRELSFIMKTGSDKGLIWVAEDGEYLRLSRGFGGSPNTMLSLTQYKRK